MAEPRDRGRGPDLSHGITLADFGDRQMLRGHVGKTSVLLVRVDNKVLAVYASCTHYGGALEDGILTGEMVRCPLHRACFGLRKGEALGAPAFDPLSCWLVEHWVVADRQGQIATENMLGASLPIRHASFLWSAHYDTTIRYVGHAEAWDECCVVDGNIAAHDASISYRRGGQRSAVATIGRDIEALAKGHRLAGAG